MNNPLALMGQQGAREIDNSGLPVFMFRQVRDFYQLPSVYDSSSQIPVDQRQEAKLYAAEAIGANLDCMAIDAMETRGLLTPDTVVNVVSPLRGATSLEAGFINPDSTNGILDLRDSGYIADASLINLGIKRNGPVAEIYFPQDRHVEFSPSEVVIVKDMGIATGGTAAEVIQIAVANGADPRKILIMGAIGTEMAKDRIATQIVESALTVGVTISLEEATEQVMFAVKGQMPVERDEHNEDNPHMDYYLDTIFNVNGQPCPVNAQDWGDETNGVMKGDTAEAEINRYLRRLNMVSLAYNAQGLTRAEAEYLKSHYMSKSREP